MGKKQLHENNLRGNSHKQSQTYFNKDIITSMTKLKGSKATTNDLIKPNEDYRKLSEHIYTPHEYLENWEIDNNFNHEKEKLYYNKNNPNKKIIAFRGTVPTDIDDIYNDMLIIFGLEQYSNRFKNSVEFTENIKKHIQIQIFPSQDIH